MTAPTTGTVGYGYDAAGERTSLTYPSGHQATYAYTARGQLQSVTDWNGKQTSYTYDNAGRLTAVARPNGVGTTLGYDNADRLTSIAHALGNTNLESIGYTLDAVGNRTSQTVNGVTTTNTFDAADRMTASGSTSFTYDNNGNELTKTNGSATTTYAYDLLNRLTGIGGATTASYAYNGDGLRVAKTVNGTSTSYAWDATGLGTVLSDGSEYLWGNGLVSQVTASGTTYAQPGRLAPALSLRRPPTSPWRRRLESRRGAQHRGVVVAPADDLEAHGQAVIRPTAGNGDRRLASENEEIGASR